MSTTAEFWPPAANDDQPGVVFVPAGPLDDPAVYQTAVNRLAGVVARALARKHHRERNSSTGTGQ